MLIRILREGYRMAMEKILGVYVVVWFIGASINLVVWLRRGAAFERYMETHHSAYWSSVQRENPIKAIFARPLRPGRAFEFVWKSEETLGDPQIVLLRHKLRWTLYGWFMYLLGGFIGAALLGIFLERSR